MKFRLGILVQALERVRVQPGFSHIGLMGAFSAEKWHYWFESNQVQSTEVLICELPTSSFSLPGILYAIERKTIIAVMLHDRVILPLHEKIQPDFWPQGYTTPASKSAHTQLLRERIITWDLHRGSSLESFHLSKFLRHSRIVEPRRKTLPAFKISKEQSEETKCFCENLHLRLSFLNVAGLS